MRLMTALLLAALAAALPAAPANPGGVYQQYRPAPKPTPAARADVARISIHQPSLSIALKGGLAARLGEEAKFHTAGFNGGADFIYQATPDLAAAVALQYASIPYSVTTAAQAMSCFGIGIRALYNLFEVEGIRAYLSGGLGYMMSSRATQVLLSVDPVTAKPTYETKYQQSGGMAFTGGLGTRYNFTPKFGLLVDLAATSVSLAGGTGDNLLLFHPSAGVLFSF